MLDSWALFASAALLIAGQPNANPKITGINVDQNGDCVPIVATARRMVRAVKGTWKEFFG